MQQPNRYTTIIVALDGSSQTERVLGPARDLAQLYDATLVLVRDLDPDTLPPESAPVGGSAVAMGAGPAVDSMTGMNIPSYGMSPPEAITPSQSVENPEAAGYLNILDHELEAAGLRVEHVASDEGDPAEAIIHVANSRGASLIVMGTHQRRGMERLFRGSVAERVLRASPCPVLVVPLE